ncbi:RNase H domain-containing protein [Aphis craccivora]|uniref:RNase H domain-containing protein n=1 Tax=Aphis craccivora TaxID=307492 RepID=A0A6G0Z441_APHCR|nr:RNase H domain-containing protein [Aphis craccivora]
MVKTDEAAKEASTNNNDPPKIELSSLKDTIRCTVKRRNKAHQKLWNQKSKNKLQQIKTSLAQNL